MKSASAVAEWVRSAVQRRCLSVVLWHGLNRTAEATAGDWPTEPLHSVTVWVETGATGWKMCCCWQQVCVWWLSDCVSFGGRSENIGTVRRYVADGPLCEQLALSTDNGHTEEDRDNCRTASSRNIRAVVTKLRSRPKPGSRRVWRRVARGLYVELDYYGEIIIYVWIQTEWPRECDSSMLLLL